MANLLVSPIRARLFALINALEQDLTEYIRVSLLPLNQQEELLSADELAGVRSRQLVDGETDTDEAQEDDDLIHFLFLSDKIQVLNRWKGELPSEEAQALTGLAGEFNGLNDIRRRTHHHRPLHNGDEFNGLMYSVAISSSALPFERLRKVSGLLQADVHWAPSGLSIEDPSSILHNIPPGDFDETGLIGRETERAGLRQYLLSATYRVVSVVAPGGFGKTALAIQVLHDIKDDPESPYEIIAFVSLQTEQLTARGIQAVTDSVDSLEEALPRILEPVSDEVPGSTEELAVRLDGLRALLVLDNLETVTGREVIEFVELMPSGVSFLFTSRVGIGEVERRMELKPLGLLQGVHLLRELCRVRGLEYLQQAEQSELESIVDRLDRVPLKIKWLVQVCETGLDPQTVLANTDDLDAFCVSNLFEGLSPQSAAAAWVMFVLDRPLSPPNLISYLETDADESRRAIQELTRHMFINHISEGSSTQPMLQLSPLLRSYMQRLDARGESARSLMDRAIELDAEIKIQVRRLEHDRARGLLGPNVIRGGSEHDAARSLLRRALSLSYREVESAHAIIDEAEEIDPAFWEVARVRAFVLSLDRRPGVVQAYDKALDLAPEIEKPYVKFFFAGYLVRQHGEHEQVRGLQLARESSASIDHPNAKFTLATALQRNRKLEESIELFHELLDGSSDFVFNKKIVTALLSSYRRSADDAREIAKDPLMALGLLDQAVELAQEAADEGLADEKAAKEMAKAAVDLLATARLIDDISVLAGPVLRASSLCEFINGWPGTHAPSKYLESHAGGLVLQHPDLEEALGQWSSPPSGIEEAEGDESRTRFPGRIVNFDFSKGFGFINTPAMEENVFFHVSSITRDEHSGLVGPGGTVVFRMVQTARGPEAVEVELESSGEPEVPLTDRICTVWERRGTYALATDSSIPERIYVSKDHFVDEADWDAVQVGTRVRVDIVRTMQGLAAKERSARLA